MQTAHAVEDNGMQNGEEQFLTFRLHGQDYGITILKIQEIKGWDKVTPIPNSPEPDGEALGEADASGPTDGLGEDDGAAAETVGSGDGVGTTAVPSGASTKMPPRTRAATRIPDSNPARMARRGDMGGRVPVPAGRGV